MNDDQIRLAIDKAQRGIHRYLEIMSLFPKADVSRDPDFQRKYNGFYRVRQRSAEWYRVYFSLMEEYKNNPITFESVIDRMKERTGRYEPSFSSKLAATLDPKQPVWDTHILSNMGHRAPSYTDPNKINKAKLVFSFMRDWYSKTLESPEGIHMIKIFDDMVDEHHQITDLKKIDFILWQTRP